MLWAGDGNVDTFRIRIWSEDSAEAERVAYDNGWSRRLAVGPS
jgi:hypothetical protein